MTFESIINRIQAQGERMTLQRRLVIEVLCQHEGHLTLAEINTHLATQLPEPTIYRILQWLKNLEIISQTDMGEAGIAYEIISSPPHHHLICLSCGKVMEIGDSLLSDVRQQLQVELSFTARIDHMAIYGYCEGCQTASYDKSN